MPENSRERWAWGMVQQARALQPWPREGKLQGRPWGQGPRAWRQGVGEGGLPSQVVLALVLTRVGSQRAFARGRLGLRGAQALRVWRQGLPLP